MTVARVPRVIHAARYQGEALPADAAEPCQFRPFNAEQVDADNGRCTEHRTNGGSGLTGFDRGDGPCRYSDPRPEFGGGPATIVPGEPNLLSKHRKGVGSFTCGGNLMARHMYDIARVVQAYCR